MFCAALQIFAVGDVRPYVLISAALGIFVILLLLDLALRREWVKQNLPHTCIKSISIRWAPFAPGWGVYWRPGFRVIYIDGAGRVHKAYCRPRNITWRCPLVWVRDELIDEHSSFIQR
jgi:hypothetical protein